MKPETKFSITESLVVLLASLVITTGIIYIGEPGKPLTKKAVADVPKPPSEKPDSQQLVIKEILQDPQGHTLWTMPIKGKQSMVVLRIIDGDTVEAAYLVGPIKIRLNGIDAPEKNTPEGKQAKAYMEWLLPRQVVLVAELNGIDKYGRQLADFHVQKGEEFGWCSWWMVTGKHAKPWSGTGPKP